MLDILSYALVLGESIRDNHVAFFTDDVNSRDIVAKGRPDVPAINRAVQFSRAIVQSYGFSVWLELVRSKVNMADLPTRHMPRPAGCLEYAPLMRLEI